MYDWLYKELDLPHPPDWMIDSAKFKLPDVFNINDSVTVGLGLSNFSGKDKIQKISEFNNNNEQNSLSRTLYKDGKEEKHATLFHIELEKNVRSWVDETISNQYTGVAVVWSYAGKNTLGVHTDKIRDYTLIYLLESGGTNVETVFYQEQNKPLFRENKEFLNDYSKLKKLDKIVIKEKTWTILNSRVLHGVENIESSRIAIQIGFKENYIKNTLFADKL